MNIDAYLKRFNANRQSEPSLSHLIELQKSHLLHIPFENLDVIRRVPIYLNLESIYEKVVGRNRGGYCYELNGLFHWLLVQLGYDATLLAGTIRRPEGHWAKPDTHAIILVRLDELYLIDVGYGDSTLSPIPLSGKEITDVSGAYKVNQVEQDQYDLIQSRNDHLRILYRFTTESKDLSDFHEGIVFNQVAKESSFTHKDIVTMATTNGRITLIDDHLTRVANGKQTKSDLSSDEKTSILQTIFGIFI